MTEECGNTLASAGESSSEALVLTRKQFAGTILGLQLILLLAALDQTIITTAMPRIVADLGGFTEYAWATTSYLLTSTIAVPVFGRLSDIYGRKPLLLGGTALFVVASVFCGCAGWTSAIDSMTALIIARAFQGLGGGIMLGLIFTVIADMLAPADRGRYQGHFAAVFALASIAGPTLGGWVADQLSWRWLFFINVPVGALAMLVFWRSFPGALVKKQQIDLDIAGIAAFCATLVPLLLGLSWLSQYTWSSPQLFITLPFAALMCCAFIFIELKARDPLLPLSLFSRSVMAICSISLFVTGIGMFGSVLLIPLFLQSVVGVSAALSGALLSPLIITVAVASVIGGLILSRKKQYKALILFSLLLQTVGTFQLSKISAESHLTYILAFMLVVGAGMGLLLPVYTIVIQNSVAQEEVGTVTGFSQFFRSIGGTVGVALFGSLMLGSYHHELNKLLPPSLPPQTLAALANPLAPAKMKAQLMAIDPHVAATLFDHVRQALVVSIDGVFSIYAGALAITLILTLWLEEKPLRSANATVGL
ncbi:MAG TPA: MDR family MFS transporter [Planktothrix sp.]|jgi:EmrB/QacA subfamily drug resistance transporter